MKNLFLSVQLLLCPFVIFTQVHFNKSGESTDASNSYYYRESAGDGFYKSFYTTDKTPFFEGKIKNANSSSEKDNKYVGQCTWYHKRGIKKAVINYDENGLENGFAKYYYEDGKIWKEVEYVEGKIRYNTFYEYDQSGVKYLIFEDYFDSNVNDWDLFSSSMSISRISDGRLHIKSLHELGTSRFIPTMSHNSEFVLEGTIDLKENKKGGLAGLIYGFKDWDNYHYFFITASSYYIGFVFEGIHTSKADGLPTTAIKTKEINNLKILSNGEKVVYSINGQVINSAKYIQNFGNKIGFAVKDKGEISSDRIILKSVVGADYATASSETDVKSTGSGVLFNKEGYILTNHHVIENSKNIFVDVTTGGAVKTLKAELIVSDKENDLAIIKINDENFIKPTEIEFSFKENGNVEVGETVFTIGYPFALTGMGKDAKFTDGKVSSKRGYDGAINSFQTTIPVQPGNSGGPVYNEKGEFVGLISAKIANADNVSYAVKLNYIRALLDLTPNTVDSPSSKNISGYTLEEKIKLLSKYSVLIKIK